MGETPKDYPTISDLLSSPPPFLRNSVVATPLNPLAANTLLMARIPADKRQHEFATVARGLFEAELAAQNSGKWWFVGDPSAGMNMTFRAMRAAGKAQRPENPRASNSILFARHCWLY